MSMTDRQPHTTLHVGGLFVALAPALFYAIAVNVVPKAYAFGASAVLVLAIRYVTNIIIASTLSWKQRRSWSSIPSADRWALLVVSLAMMGQTFGMMTAIETLPVSVAITIFFTFPIVSYFIERLQRRTRPHIVAVLALLTSLYGVWLMTKSSTMDWNVHGIWWALMSSFLQATVQSAAERVQTVHGWSMVKLSSFLPAAFFVTLAIGEAPALSIEAVSWAVVASAGFSLAIYFLYRSVRVNGAVRAANLLYLEPVLVIPISMAMHGDVLSLEQWGGIVLIGIGCAIVEWRERRLAHRSAITGRASDPLTPNG